MLNVPNAACGITYDSINSDVPVFLDYLFNRFVSLGGRVRQASVRHLKQIIDGDSSVFGPQVNDESHEQQPFPDGAIICAGLGARTLGGVEDKAVYPVRGQILRIRAPWLIKCMSMSGGPGGKWTYVIPRRSGDAILGGTYEENDQ